MINESNVCILHTQRENFTSTLCTKKEGRKKKIKKPKDIGLYLIQNLLMQIFLNTILVERKACCHVGNAFLNRLQLIWLLSRIKISKLSKKCIFGKKLQCQCINQ